MPSVTVVMTDADAEVRASVLDVRENYPFITLRFCGDELSIISPGSSADEAVAWAGRIIDALHEAVAAIQERQRAAAEVSDEEWARTSRVNGE